MKLRTFARATKLPGLDPRDDELVIQLFIPHINLLSNYLLLEICVLGWFMDITFPLIFDNQVFNFLNKKMADSG